MTSGRPRLAHVTTVDSTLRFMLLRQLRAYSEAGYDVTAVSAPGPWVPDLEDAGIRHVPWRRITRSWAPMSDLRACAELFSILRRERFDLVHTHNPKPGLFGRPIARMCGVPAVVNTVHGLYATPDHAFGRRAFVYTTEALAARTSHAELVQSAEDFRLLTEKRISPAHRTIYLGNGIDLSRFPGDRDVGSLRSGVRDRLGVDEGEILVGTVGRLVREKGISDLLDAMASLGDGYRLVVIGPTDAAKADAIGEEEVRAAEARGVIFRGFQLDLVPWYAAMDIFVLASYREGVPRATIEASAMGLPVIATDIRGCREVVRKDHSGFLVPVHDPGSLTTAIRTLGKQPDVRARFGETGRAHVRSEFDEEKVIERTLRVYERVLRHRSMLSATVTAGGPR